MIMEFAGQTAVISGASSGIGKAIAASLAAEGAALFLIGRDRERLDDMVKDLPGGAVAVTCLADLTHDEDIERVGRDLERHFPKIDILIHSIGAIVLSSMESASIADLDLQYAVNVRVPYALTRRLLPLIIHSQGQIVFVNSSAGVQNGRKGSGQYAATKHALKAVADSLREEVNQQGVRILSVYPGRTATPMQERVHHMEQKDYHPERLLQPRDISTMVLSALSLSRTAEVTDIHIRPMSL
jgi:NADP-dependent 3-hydroxy acid dehydrogenase YdfG